MKIKNKLLFFILSLALIPAIAISLVFYITTHDILREQIEKAHYESVFSVDTLISVVVGDMVNIAFTAVPKIADLIEAQDLQGIREKLRLIDLIDKPEIGTGRGLGYHILIVTDKQGNILARSNVVTKEGQIIGKQVDQVSHIFKGWLPPDNFRVAFDNARIGQIDARKVIYNKAFIRREGYGHLIDEHGYKEIMGLTAQLPIFNQEREQLGIFIIITILNNNNAAIGAINAITGAEFTAITPTGEIMASFFVNPPRPVEIIVNGKTLVEKARIRVNKIREGLKESVGRDTVFYTKERIYLRPCPGIVVFRNGEGACYVEGVEVSKEELEEKAYRFHFIAEVDQDFKYVSIRGIAYDLTEYDLLVAAQEKHFTIVFLITFLMIGGLSLIIAKRGAAPIVEFTKKIQQIEKEGFGEKINIKTGDEIETLVKAFNNMSGKIIQSYQELEEQRNVLEIKVNARTKELRELAETLEKRVEEKTKELQDRIIELERFQKITVGRELKMVELKEKIKELTKELE